MCAQHNSLARPNYSLVYAGSYTRRLLLQTVTTLNKAFPLPPNFITTATPLTPDLTFNPECHKKTSEDQS